MKRLVTLGQFQINKKALRTTLLSFVIIVSLAYGAADIVNGLEARLLWSMGGISFMLGWFLARRRLPAWMAGIIGLVSGFGFVLWWVARLGAPFLNLQEKIISYMWLTITERSWASAADLLDSWTNLLLSLQVVFVRLGLWLQLLLSSEPSHDPIVLALIWGFAVWCISIWAGWALSQGKQPIIAALPALFVLGYSLAFVRGSAFFLLPMMGAVLLLSILVNYDDREEEWKSWGARTPHLMGPNVSRVALLISAALVMIAAIVPSFSIDDINDFVRDITEQQKPILGESLGLVAEPASAPVTSAINPLSEARRGGLPRQHLIGSGPELSEQIVMVISATEIQPEIGTDLVTEIENSNSGYYWRSLTYDQYTGKGWVTDNIEIETYQAGEFAITTSLPGQHLLRQQVSLLVEGSDESTNFLFVAGNLITSNQPYVFAWRPITSEDDNPDFFGATTDSTTYVADSLLPIFSEDELRAASQDFPSNILDHYLALPKDVPDRVFSLAFDLTATQPTAFDRAIAIESYLRTFEYNLDILPPPQGLNIDIADYFLFELQEGYCDYYATSMVVLARAAGLPARFVQGYIGGTYDPENDVYIVTEDQAHSWVEIYFPDFGWVEFEPTAGRPALERPLESLPEIPPEFVVEAGFLEPLEDLLPPLTQPGENPWTIFLRFGQYVLIAIFAFVLVWPFVEIYRLWFFAPSIVVSNVYARIYRYGGHLDIPARREKTPHEFSVLFSERFSELLHRRRPTEFLQTAHENIDWLTGQFTHFRYGRNQPGRDVKKRAIQMWLQLRSAMWAARWEAWRSRFKRVEEDEEE